MIQEGFSTSPVVWVIGVPILILAVLVASYLYWRISISPHLSGTIRCFLIHDVVARPSFRSAAEITLDRLRFFIDEAIAAGFEFVRPQAFFSRENRRKILLTFDDGFDSVYKYVYPILREKQIPALIFTVDAFAGRSPAWDYHVSGRRHLTGDQIAEMKGSGLVAFGCHSATHPDLTRLSRSRIRWELTQSKPDSRRYLSYPFGRFNREVIGVARETGFERGFASLNGIAARWDMEYAIPRMPLSIFDTSRTIRTKLRGGRLYWSEVLKARFIGMFAPLTYEWRRRP